MNQKLEALGGKTEISTDGAHQIVILPEDFKMTGTEVYIKKVGNVIVLIAKDNPWQSLFESLDHFSEDFTTTRDPPPPSTSERLSRCNICLTPT